MTTVSSVSNVRKGSRSLSERKSKVKVSRSIRNFLAIPYKEFWPLLTPEEAEPLLECLTHLKAARKENQSGEASEALPQVEQKEARKFLILGTNSLVAAFEKGSCSCCLVSEDTHPRILIKHLAAIAKQRGVPIAIVPGLREACNEHLGFPALILGFSKEAEEPGNVFNECCSKVLSVARELWPEEDVCAIDIESCPNITGLINLEKPPESVDVKDFIVTRTSNSYRVFNPGRTTTSSKSEMGDFTSLRVDTMEFSAVESASRKRIFQPPQIVSAEFQGKNKSKKSRMAFTSGKKSKK